MKRRLVTIGALLLVLAGFAVAGASAGSPANPIVVKSPRLANLWLCTEDADTCRNKNSGVEEVNLNVDLRGAVSGTAKGEPQTIGSFEFEVRYDAKLVSVQVEAGALWRLPPDTVTPTPLRPGVQCASNPGEGFVQFRCVTKGKPEAPRGPGTLAVVRVRATSDVYSKLIANQKNGIVTQLLNQDCNLSDLQGHPIELGEPDSFIDPCGDTSITIRYLEGDVHADCVVDIHDQQQIAFRWASHEGQLLYNSRFDLEPSSPKLGDGDIDAKDLQTVFGRHDSTCKAPHPAQDPIDPKSCVSLEEQIILELGQSGVDLLDPATLIAAVSIVNDSQFDADDVHLNAINLTGGTLTSPSLPYDVGDIPEESSAILNVQFSGAFEPSGSYVLELEGTYLAGDTTYCFTISKKLVVPPAAPGSGLLGTATVDSHNVTGGTFPPIPPGNEEEEEGVNGPGWVVPNAPFEPLGTVPGQTSVGPAVITTSAGSAAGDAAPAGTNPVVFNTNASAGISNGNLIAEPSGASGGGVVFITSNTFAAYSTNGGASYTKLNPSAIFPADAVGLCCDQIVQYIPSIDRFVWLLQGTTGVSTAGYRLAMASPATIIASGGTAWTYWNLTTGVFGACTNFDYPDMSLGNNQLYISWDAATAGACNGGLQVMRTSFTGIQAGGTITVEFTAPANGSSAWGSHLMQDTGDEIFWAGHQSNKKMRVFSLQESSNTYFWRDVGISTWANNSPLSSLSPDNQNWLNFLHNPTTQNPSGGFPKNAVLGATRVGNQLWFAWSAGTDSNFSQPHIEIVTLNRTDFSKIQQVQVWNSSYAFAYPALATNDCTGEVGMSFEFGGGGNYENHVVGFWGDFVAYITTSSNVGSTRFGDYVTIRHTPPTEENPGNLFDAFGYGLNSVPPPGAGTVSDIHYVVFGRPPSECEPVIG